MDKSDPEPADIKNKKRQKIIYVDDSQSSLITLKRRIMNYFEVYPALSCETLYKILEKVIPDLILLDINMPDVDGYQIIESLKADERYADIPIIFLSGSRDKESVIKGLKLGAVDYVIKPFNTTKLIDCICQHTMSDVSSNISQDTENDNRPKILAVDDVVSILKTIKSVLREKYKVFTLAKAESVMDFLKIKKPDLILLDFLMPVFNGFELIEMIRSLPEHKDTPIIMITTEGKLSQIKEAIAIGASDFIVKPFNENELKEKIAKQIEKKQQTEIKSENIKNS